MSEELKPCPFCGGKAEYHDNATNYDWVFCTVCKAQVPGNYGKQVPRRQWNTRTPPEYKYQKFADYCEESEWSYDKELSFNAARDLKEK
jgi:Lar family restriction alleviation protein